MNTEKSFHYSVKVTANRKIYEHLTKGTGITISYPRNCKKCQRHRKKMAMKNQKTKPEFKSKLIDEAIIMRDLHQKQCCSGSPLIWQTSPLIQDEVEQTNQFSENTNIQPSLKSKLTSGEVNHDMPLRHFNDNKYVKVTCHEPSRSPKLNISSKLNNIKSKTGSVESNTKTANMSSVSLDSEREDITSIESNGIRCRYCLGCDNIPNSNHLEDENELQYKDEFKNVLIAPCLCSGSSKFVHKHCLEKWLATKKTAECEVCKTGFEIQWVHRPICSVKFPKMKSRDVLLLVGTILFYITMAFQFLGAIYLSSIKNTLEIHERIITLMAVSLSIFWVLIGSIILTIVLHTSDYWTKWRYLNRRRLILVNYNKGSVQRKDESANNVTKLRSVSDASIDLSLAVPV